MFWLRNILLSINSGNNDVPSLLAMLSALILGLALHNNMLWVDTCRVMTEVGGMLPSHHPVYFLPFLEGHHSNPMATLWLVFVLLLPLT